MLPVPSHRSNKHGREVARPRALFLNLRRTSALLERLPRFACPSTCSSADIANCLPTRLPVAMGGSALGCLGDGRSDDARDGERAQRETNRRIERELQREKQLYRATHRLLLLGNAPASTRLVL